MRQDGLREGHECEMWTPHLMYDPSLMYLSLETREMHFGEFSSVVIGLLKKL